MSTNPEFAYFYREGLTYYTEPHLIDSVKKKVFGYTPLKEQTNGRSILHRCTRHQSSGIQIMTKKISEANYMPLVLHFYIICNEDRRKCHFDEAERKEILALIERGTFQIVLADEADDKPSILLSIFVLSIKRSDSGPPIIKARLVLGSNRDN